MRKKWKKIEVALNHLKQQEPEMSKSKLVNMKPLNCIWPGSKLPAGTCQCNIIISFMWSLEYSLALFEGLFQSTREEKKVSAVVEKCLHERPLSQPYENKKIMLWFKFNQSVQYVYIIFYVSLQITSVEAFERPSGLTQCNYWASQSQVQINPSSSKSLICDMEVSVHFALK